MKIERLPHPLTACKLDAVQDFALDGEFYFLGRTDGEISLVCPTAQVPAHTAARSDGWRGFRICGQLDFSLIGILSRLSTILAERGIGIFAVSTFDTDYILVKEAQLQPALDALAENGYTII